MEPDHEIKNGKYFYYFNGRYCSERDKCCCGKEVIEELLKHAKKK